MTSKVSVSPLWSRTSHKCSIKNESPVLGRYALLPIAVDQNIARSFTEWYRSVATRWVASSDSIWICWNSYWSPRQAWTTTSFGRLIKSGQVMIPSVRCSMVIVLQSENMTCCPSLSHFPWVKIQMQIMSFPACNISIARSTLLASSSETYPYFIVVKSVLLRRKKGWGKAGLESGALRILGKKNR